MSTTCTKCGRDHTPRAWQRWTGQGVGEIPDGKMMKATVTGFGAVHFMRSPKGDVVVHGPLGLGKMLGDATDPSLVAAAAAMNSAFASGDPCNWGASQGVVKSFQSAWNAAGAGTALAVDGYYGPNTASANAQVAAANGGGNVIGGCTTYSNTPTPPAPTPGPQPGPQPGPTPPPAASSSSMWPWILGAAGVVAVAGVGYAVMKKPSSKELHGAATKHTHRAAMHRHLAGRLHTAGAARAREEAREARA